MKYLKSIVVIVLLFVIPAGSWYFLQSGLDWRKVKAKELVPKEQVFDLEELKSKDHPIVNRIQSKTILLKTTGDPSELDQNIMDQFKDAHTFDAVFLDQEQYGSVDQLIKGQYDYLLIDTSGKGRQTYAGGDQAVMTRVVEDIALILPQRKPKDIRMKDNLNIK